MQEFKNKQVNKTGKPKGDEQELHDMEVPEFTQVPEETQEQEQSTEQEMKLCVCGNKGYNVCMPVK